MDQDRIGSSSTMKSMVKSMFEIPKNLKKNLIKPTIVVNIWFILIVNIQRIYG